MPSAVAQKSCQVAQKQHRGKPLLTPAQKLWYNFGAAKVILLYYTQKYYFLGQKKAPTTCRGL
jgi:hypothetical protein